MTTEYGSAYLYCKSIQEKALALIEIAHPDFHARLLEEAIGLGYLTADLGEKQAGRPRAPIPNK